jgi:hypothetical protein
MNLEKLAGWGNLPVVQARQQHPESLDSVKRLGYF